jgi:hypothetical protein
VTLDEYLRLTATRGPMGHAEMQKTSAYKGARDYLAGIGMPVSEVVDVNFARGEDFDGRKHFTVTIQVLVPLGEPA